MLKRITLVRERVQDWSAYPFTVGAIRELTELQLRSRVVFLCGEHGSGKSMLLEAIARQYGLAPEGGSRAHSVEENGSVGALSRALQMTFDGQAGKGFFLRAEGFFEMARDSKELERQGLGASILQSPDGERLHPRPHGEIFLALLRHKLEQDGLFLLDEVEAVLSPQRQLSMMMLMHEVLEEYPGAQFIIATHSPLLLGYPEAQIFSFDEGRVMECAYEETEPLLVVRHFLINRREVLSELLGEELTSLD